MTDNILSKLKDEHQVAENLIEKIITTEDVVRKKELYLQLKSILIPHMEGEERTIYAHLIEDVHDEEAEEVAQHSEDEHQVVKDLLAKIDNLGIENQEWIVQFKELQKRFHEHVEEEEGALFAEVKEDFSRDELLEFADEFEEAKLHVPPY